MRRHYLFLTAFLAISLSGCSYDVVVIDSDGDGVSDEKDACPYDKLKTTDPGKCGCGYREAKSETGNLICQSLGLVDSDGDTVPDIYDECPQNPSLHVKDEKCGCDTDGKVDIATQARICQTYLDSDGDGVVDDLDGCPYDSSKTEPGECGCGQIDYRENVEQETLICMPNIDSDSDTVPDVYDACPFNPLKKVEGNCGCDKPEEPSCGTAFEDRCPGNEKKLEPGFCGCNMLDIDQCPRNGVPDCMDVLNSHLMANPPACLDLCPEDDEKIEPGFCGCGVKDIDVDGDGNVDYCLTGEDKCTVDSDGDNVPDCLDQCPFNKDIQFDDADCDGTPDAEDACPHNPEITLEAQKYQNAYPCQYNDVTQTFTVATGEDLSLLREFLEEQWRTDEGSRAPMPRKPISLDDLAKERLTIRLIDNIQITLPEYTSELDEWGDVISSTQWLPLPPVFNADIIGGFIHEGKKGKEGQDYNEDPPIRITVTDGKKRVPLAGPLFLSLDYTKVSNLILDYDVEGTFAAGMAGGIMASTLDRLTFSGSITKQQEESQVMWDYVEFLLENLPALYVESEMLDVYRMVSSVAGFAAGIFDRSLIYEKLCNEEGEGCSTIDIPPVVIKDTVCDHAKLYNDGLEYGVAIGCIAGEVSAQVEYRNADDLKNTINVLHSSGYPATIGGLFGKVWGNVTLNHIKNEIDAFTCFGTCGGMIGLINGRITATNVSNVIHNMTCDVPSFSDEDVPRCGGAFGSIDLYIYDGSENSVEINHLENRIDELKASGTSGGLVGRVYVDMWEANDNKPFAVFEHIFSEVRKFETKTNEESSEEDISPSGLLFGELSVYADGMEMSSAFKLSNSFTIGQMPYLLGNELEDPSVLDVRHLYYYGAEQIFGRVERDGGDIPEMIKFQPDKIADVVKALNESATPEIWTSKEIEFVENGNKKNMSIPVFKDSAFFDAAQE